MKLLLSPHMDDESLFAAYVCLRERPRVVFCFDGAPRHGSFATRRAEASEAMRVLGCEWQTLRATPETIQYALAAFDRVEHVWAPWPEPGGNSDHNLVGEVASYLWPDRISFYTTYTDDGRTTLGDRLEPEHGWEATKRLALSCYRSQYRQRAMRPHFNRGPDEYVIELQEALAWLISSA